MADESQPGTEGFPGQAGALSALARVRMAARNRLGHRGIELLEEHPDRLVVQIAGRQHSLYLTNAALSAEKLDGRPFEQFIDDWLGRQLNAAQIDPKSEQFRTLAAVQGSLMPRLVAVSGSARPGQMWTRPICPDQLDLALVVDMPDYVAFATPQMVAGWGEAAAEAAAMANLRGRVSPEDFRPLPDTVRLSVCVKADGYAASRALLAEELLASGRPHGVLAALPSRDLLLAEPLAGESIQDIVHLALLAQKATGDLPYALSGQVFWIRGGRWDCIPIRIVDGHMDVDPPEEFVEVLRRIMPDGQTDQ